MGSGLSHISNQGCIAYEIDSGYEVYLEDLDKSSVVIQTYPERPDLLFPNETLEKILYFLSIRDKLIARQVCTSWLQHINAAGGLQDTLKIKVSSDEISHLTSSPFDPVFTSFYFHKVDITRQTKPFWSLYTDLITHLDFYDCSIIPRNTADSDKADFNLGCPNLKHLSLINCDKYFLMGGKFIQLHDIICLDNLESLNLSRNKNLTDSILFSILLKTKKLKCLDLSDCVNMVFMKAVHNRFYPATTSRPPYSDNVLSFHSLCMDFLQTENAKCMTKFNFGMKLNSTGMQLLLDGDHIKWECANLESPELKVVDIKQFLSKFSASLLRVELGRCKLSEEDLSEINLQNCQKISMHDSHNVRSIHFLETMPKLRKVVLDGTNGFQFTSQPLANLQSLAELSLHGIQPSNDRVECQTELVKCFQSINLTSLDLGNCPQLVTDDVIYAIITNLKKLKHLNIRASAISDFGLTCVRNHGSLQTSTDGETETLVQIMYKNRCKCSLGLFNLTELEHLDISHCKALGDLSWRVALQLPNLISLNLSDCTTLSKRGIMSIINNCRNLEDLIMVHCSRQIITDLEVINAARQTLYRSIAVRLWVEQKNYV